MGSADELADYLAAAVDARLLRCLHAARGVITGRVAVDDIDPDRIPAELHQATIMLAAAIYRRVDSPFGVDAFAVGGDSSPGFLTSDPTIMQLLERWRRPGLAVVAAASESI